MASKKTALTRKSGNAQRTLKLHRETVRHLSEAELGRVQGASDNCGGYYEPTKTWDCTFWTC